jgi:hypothetical protein
MSGLVVGIDFDNTIATYDEVFHQLARDRGLIAETVPCSKRHIRDAVRQLDEGEWHWQRLQAAAYGTHMPAAALASGLAVFLRRCREAGVTVHVVSHRTPYAAVDPEGVLLRDAALAWMRAQALFGRDGLGIAEDHVFFGSTRAEKIEQIARIGCSHFIDDLEEVLLEPRFPAGVVKILYAPHDNGTRRSHDGIHAVASWDAVHEVIFGRGW